MEHQEGRSAADRLDQLESQVEALMGHVKALEYGLRLTLATHPRPEVLVDALGHITGDAIAANPDVDGSGPMYQAALRQGLLIIRAQLSASVALPSASKGSVPSDEASSGRPAAQ